MKKTLVEYCIEALGTDVTPDDLVPDIVACAITVSTLMNKVDSTFPKVSGTWTLYDILVHRKDYEKVNDMTPGTIVISPTGMGNSKKLPNGHVGICTRDNKIASNNSDTGLFTENYTLDTWTKRYVTMGEYPLFLFRKK